jgi:hypothetical protein
LTPYVEFALALHDDLEDERPAVARDVLPERAPLLALGAADDRPFDQRVEREFLGWLQRRGDVRSVDFDDNGLVVVSVELPLAGTFRFYKGRRLQRLVP